MFTKVLIANRGAIATRIMRTLKGLGIESIAIYAESDFESLHVRQANQAFSLGAGPAKDTYLNIDKILTIAKEAGADAIHPGYGFLSENAEFVKACEQQNIAFIGPTAQQINEFGLKHTARQLAEQANVPLLKGSELLNSLEQAIEVAKEVGFPIMLKSTAGGGGIGMKICHDVAELENSYQQVKHLSQQNFSNDGMFIEKFIENARHIEVQTLGDGKGTVIAIGERDCSAQRRNQKVIEECPAPNLNEATKTQLHQLSEQLLSSVNYRNAATVEYILDADTEQFYFLEVNTRLQVEHGVTEAVYNIDLVEWMVKIAANAAVNLTEIKSQFQPKGHAIQARLYAEDPYKNFQPSAGLISYLQWPELDNGKKGLRIDHWIEAGITVPADFDPMLAKVIVHQDDREQAIAALNQALADTEIFGIQTNIDYIKALCADSIVIEGKITTRYLNEFQYQTHRIDILSAGTQTTLQDYPGRAGFWNIGVPPSGAFDSFSFQLGNRLLENDINAAGLEILIHGPILEFSCNSQIVLTGANVYASLDGKKIPPNTVVSVKAKQTLTIGKISGDGVRAYLCIKGGIHSPEYLGSKSTFTLGQFGGHNGRALQSGDVLSIDTHSEAIATPSDLSEIIPELSDEIELKVIYGPHGAPEFFTYDDIQTLFDTSWEVHYNSSRTGVRLIGPKPEWARKDGGEAGLHPSNIHDNAYAFGSVDFTGDMPVILGPDGPSLGGFVCPITVIKADLWKLGQLKAGHRIRFMPVSINVANNYYRQQRSIIRSLKAPEHHDEDDNKPISLLSAYEPSFSAPVVKTLSKEQVGEEVTYRLAGDQFLLIEYGTQRLDIALRFRAHGLMQMLEQAPRKGILELTPGIRTLQVHYQAEFISLEELISYLESLEYKLADNIADLEVPSRIIHLPLSWDDKACAEAVEKYNKSVRADAPWYPSNIEFIRRINGLADVEAVKQIVFDASYLVMGLGDVYLGAPVATPIDPRHRLVTTKYNPARTWTAENCVGIGGSYLCIYGMEGPGGYQFIGRTLQMWNRYRQTNEFDKPWLLRFFDQIRFYEVSHEELNDIRKKFPLGQYPIKIEQSSFSLNKHLEFLKSSKNEIEHFTHQRDQAFAEELAHWHDTNQFNFEVEEQAQEEQENDWPEHALVIESPVSGSVWKCLVDTEAAVNQDDTLIILESMKMEIPIKALQQGTVIRCLVSEGQQIKAGQPLLVIENEGE